VWIVEMKCALAFVAVSLGEKKEHIHRLRWSI
jgi:hypothetical protein